MPASTTMTRVCNYGEAIKAAQDLLCEQIRDPEGERKAEYTRGMCELLADCFAQSSREDVARDIGLPLSAL